MMGEYTHLGFLRTNLEGVPSNLRLGLNMWLKMKVFFNKWPLFCSKIGMLGFLGIENLHKKFGVDISKIVDFFLMSNFWWSFFSFLIL